MLAATVTDAGSVAAVLFDDKVTTVPPAGAATASMTKPMEVLPPTTVTGLRDQLMGLTESTLKYPETLAPLSVAVSV